MKSSFWNQDLFKCGFLVLLATGVKVLFIGKTGIGGDECFSAYIAQFPVPRIISVLSHGDNPPLWEIILHYWIQLFGINEVSLRIPSLIFSVLTVVPLYFIGEKFVVKNGGLIASLLFIFSSFGLFISHEARTYSLVGFLATVSLYLFLTLIRKPEKKSFYVYLTLVNALLLFSHYLAGWVIAVQVLSFLIIGSVRRGMGVRYVLHLLGITLLFSPNIPVLLERFMDSGVHGTWIKPVNGIESLYNMLWTFSNMPLVTVCFILIFVIALFKLAIQRPKWEARSATDLVLILSFWVPILLSFLASFKVGFFMDRYFYFILPAYFLGVVLCLNYVLPREKRIVSSVLFLAPVALMLFTVQLDSSKMRYSGFHKDTKSVAAEISTYIQADRTVIILSPPWYDKQIVYYLNRDLFETYFQAYDDAASFKEPLRELDIIPLDNYRQVELSKPYERVVYVDIDQKEKNRNSQLFKQLNSQYNLLREYVVADRVFFVFEARS